MELCGPPEIFHVEVAFRGPVVLAAIWGLCQTSESKHSLPVDFKTHFNAPRPLPAIRNKCDRRSQ
ncbi:hypothetical protein AcV5_008256 [Taiwanofungus camphoratus]|nr:hypothetical protein AcV5_008256 [Antrodia cinnamomea]